MTNTDAQGDLYKQYIREYKEDDWKKATKALIADLSESYSFCKALGEESNKLIVPSLSDDALSAVDGNCVVHLKGLVTAQNASKFAPSAFSLFKAGDFNLKLKDLNDSQIPLISSDLPESEWDLMYSQSYPSRN